eukprot:COSAG02_NODE_33624_length_497_cov_0.984925_2_plen_106_part_01
MAHKLSVDASVRPEYGGRSGLVRGGWVCAAHGESPSPVQRATTDCGAFFLLALLCVHEPVERALWSRARLRSLHGLMLRLTLGLRRAQVHRTAAVVVAASVASASL